MVITKRKMSNGTMSSLGKGKVNRNLQRSSGRLETGDVGEVSTSAIAMVVSGSGGGGGGSAFRARTRAKKRKEGAAAG
jgi:hypothetical protein